MEMGFSLCSPKEPNRKTIFLPHEDLLGGGVYNLNKYQHEDPSILFKIFFIEITLVNVFHIYILFLLQYTLQNAHNLVSKYS